MALRRLASWLPDLYRPLVPPVFETEVPENAVADCAHCPMVKPPDGPTPMGCYFLPTTKCCTHYPELRNYLVGSLLGDGDRTEGIARLSTLIERRIGVTPLGLRRPKKYELLVTHGREGFGRAESLLCPFYHNVNGGVCTIHPHWDAVCSTWFCKFDAGEEGRLFWRALRLYLEHVERSLSLYCLLRLGLDPVDAEGTEISADALTAEQLDDRPPDDATYARMWGTWAGREETFYQETCGIVRAMSPDEFERAGGVALDVLRKRLESLCAKMLSDALPPRLRRNPKLQVDASADGGHYLTGYSPLDPLHAPAYILEIADYFDGDHEAEAVVEIIRSETGVYVSPGLIHALYRYRILIEAAAK
jgi:Fe-S-cluster containining protein